MSSALFGRVRLVIAAIVVLSALLATSAWYKDATCRCGSTGLPWQTIAMVATVVAGVSTATYVVAGVVERRLQSSAP